MSAPSSPLDRLHEDFHWTPRQRQVLDLLAARHTNGEIATALGISLDGAKWHVSEVMTKLGTNSRDEAAEYWRAYNRMPLRFSRAVRALAVTFSLRHVLVGLATLAVVGVVVLGIFLLANLSDDGGAGPSDGGTPSPTAAASPTATGAPEPTNTPEPREVTGLFIEPRDTGPDRVVSAPALPESPFDPDTGPAVVYDTFTGETIDLGEGQLGRFSPDNTRYAWAANPDPYTGGYGPITVIDLETRAVQVIGQGRGPVWLDESRVAFWFEDENYRVGVDLQTGASNPVDKLSYDAAWSRTAFSAFVPKSYRIEPDHRDPNSGCFPPKMECRYTILDAATDSPIFELEAFRVLPADEETLLVATVPDAGRTNLFLIPLATGEARFIRSTVPADFNFPLVVTSDFVAWVDGFCNFSAEGNLQVFDRSSGELTEVENGDNRWGYLYTTPDGLLGIGDFGPFVLLDPATLDVVALLPNASRAWETGTAGDIQWSSDFRFAARGITGGHGGLCGG